MTIDVDLLRAQMRNVRVVGDRFERRGDGGGWEPWPVLSLDKLARDEVERVLTRQPRQRD